MTGATLVPSRHPIDLNSHRRLNVLEPELKTQNLVRAGLNARVDDPSRDRKIGGGDTNRVRYRIADQRWRAAARRVIVVGRHGVTDRLNIGVWPHQRLKL